MRSCAAAGLVLDAAGEGNRQDSSAFLAHTYFSEPLTDFHVVGLVLVSLREPCELARGPTKH